MHKKQHSKHSKRESTQKSSSSNRLQLKCKNENEGSALELKVPQNSQCEINHGYRDVEVKDKHQLKHKHREKHKHGEHGNKNKDEEHHYKKHEKRDKHEKYDKHFKKTDYVEPIENEPSSKHQKSSRKEKQEEKSQKLDKNLEDLNKIDINKTHRSRSFSLGSSEHILKHKHIRREKTFHMEDLRKTKVSKIQINVEEKEKKKSKEKGEKKHKHKEKEAIQETFNSKNSQKQIMYCHIDTQNPFKNTKQKYIDDLCENKPSKGYKEIFSNKIRKSSSKDIGASFETSHLKRPKEKKRSDPIKYSTRKSKIKEYTKSIRDQRSTPSLGPYNEYFVLEKSSEIENSKPHRREKRRHRKTTEDNENKDENLDTKEIKRKGKQHVDETLIEKKEEIREKIEDDIKSYFTKLQSLIDRKLDYILHSASKEEKTAAKDDIPQRDTQNSPERKQEKRSRRSVSRKEKNMDKYAENGDHKSRGHKSRALEKQIEVKNVDSELKHKRNRTPREFIENKSRTHFVDAIENEEQSRQRRKSPKQLNVDKNNSSERVILAKNTPRTTEEREHRHKSKHRTSKSPQIPQRETSPNKRIQEVYAHGNNDFHVEGIEPAKLLEDHRRRSKRYDNRSMNLECKTVSIIGIPSQIKESTVFSQAQTSPSLNVIEETIEKKKQSKRFKLYYKYSVADSKCPRSASGHSSDGKSVISDSYRVISDNSEGRISDNCEDISEEPTKDSGKVIFVMKKERHTKNVYGDNLGTDRHIPKSHRKHLVMTPDISKLNNILEESSNFSLNNRTRCPANEVNCKYFRVLNTSSSDCNVKITKKPTFSDWNIHANKYRHPPVAAKNNMESIATRHSKRTSPERESFLDDKSEKKGKVHDRRVENKPKNEEDKNNQKVRKIPRNFGNKYSSKSDIDISYDSLHLRREQSNKVDRGSRAPETKIERLSRDKQSPNNLLRRSPREKSISRKVNKTNLDERLEVRNVNEESRDSHKSRLNPKAEPDGRHHATKKVNPNAVTRIPNSINRRYVEKEGSHLQCSDVSSSQHIHRMYNPERIVRNCSCQSNFKEFVDVGVEVKMNEEEPNRAKEHSLNDNEKKTFPKTAEVAVEAKFIRKKFPIYRKERVPKNVQKPLPKTNEVAIEANLPYVLQADRQINSLEKKHLPLYNGALSTFANSRNKRPVSTLYTRQKSDIVRGKGYPFVESRPVVRDSISTKRCLQKGLEKGLTQNNINKAAKKCISERDSNDGDMLRLQEKHTRSASCSEESKRDENSLRSSKSAISIREIIPKLDEIERTSSVSLQKFIDNPLKINSQFLDHCAIKSIISDNTHTSRLFLTKDFTRVGNSYQRRKMYDERIRQRMKKKMQNKLAQQVYEVRYLTLQQNSADKICEVDNLTLVKPIENRVKPPTFSCNSRTSSKNSFKRKFNFKPIAKRSLKGIINKKIPIAESASKLKLNSASSYRNPFGAIANDVDQLNRFRKKKFANKNVEEIFVSGRQVNDQSLSNMFSCCKQLADIQSSSLLIKDNATSTNNNQSPVGSSFNINNNGNFMKIVDCLCKSIVNYCNSKLVVAQGDCQESPKTNRLIASDESGDKNVKDTETHNDKYEEEEKVSDIKKVTEDVPNLPSHTKETVQPKNSQPSLLTRIEVDSPRSAISNHASCPVLASTPSSFEFLYEEESDCSREAILASLCRPVDTILGYALNNSSGMEAGTFTVLKKKVDQISNSPTDSGESGYSSNSSRKFSSVTNFFKKPNIAALFKPVPSLPVSEKCSAMSILETIPSVTEYSLMTRQCHEYAEKVRLHSENKAEQNLEEPFEEISLEVLLGGSNHSFISNCSLCKALSLSNDIKNCGSIEEIKSDDSLAPSENELETLIFYENPERQPSLEIVKLNRTQSQKSTVNICHSSSQEIIECEVVLSNTNLNRCSLTLIETGKKCNGDYIDENLASYEKLTELSKRKYNEMRSILQKSKSNLSNIMSSTLIIDNELATSQELFVGNEMNAHLQKSVSAGWLSNPVHGSEESKKALAKKFFENLIQVYDRETTVTAQLFQDDKFFVDELLSLLDGGSRPAFRSRGKQKFKGIKGKLKDCIDKVFSPKAGSNSNEGDSVKELDERFEKTHQENLKILAYNARRYFSLFVQAVRINKDINSEIKIFGLLKLLERIENGDFAILRKEEDVNLEDEIREQVKEGFLTVYKISAKEAKKCKRPLTGDDLSLMRAFVCKYRIGLLANTDLIATYIGRGLLKTENQLRAAVTYLIRSQTRDIDLNDFEEYCNVCTNCKN